MSFTFNEWDVRNSFGTPVNPYNRLAMGYADLYAAFHQWAKTQSMPAPGIADGTYSTDQIEIKTFGCRNAGSDQLPNCQCGYLTPEAKLCPDSMKELRLKSHLISGYREIQVDIRNDTDEVIELNLNDFSISEEDLERAFAFGYLANPENNCLDNKEMMRRYEVFKTEYLLPMLQRKHIID